jgi:hypothetical protein
MSRRCGEGIAWIDSLLGNWHNPNNLRHHLWWHAAIQRRGRLGHSLTSISTCRTPSRCCLACNGRLLDDARLLLERVAGRHPLSAQRRIGYAAAERIVGL